MATTIATSGRSTEGNVLDGVRPQMLKATLAVNPCQCALTAVVKDALIRRYGSLKAAAITMGNMDQGQLTRELDSGKLNLARLELLDLAGKAEIAKRLNEVFGAVTESARDRAHRIIPQLIAELLEVCA